MPLGSFGMGIEGMSPEIQEAMARRQTGSQGPQLNQASQQSPSSVSPPPPQIPGGEPQGAPQASPQGGTPKVPFENPEVELIEKALSDRLKHISKLEAPQGGGMGESLSQGTSAGMSVPKTAMGGGTDISRGAPVAPSSFGGGNPLSDFFDWLMGKSQAEETSRPIQNYFSTMGAAGRGGGNPLRLEDPLQRRGWEEMP